VSIAFFKNKLLSTCGLALAVCCAATQAEAAYVQTNLVSNIPGLAGLFDSQLVTPWGISRSPTSPFWVSNQGNSTSTLYAVIPAIGTVATKVTAVNPQGFVDIPTTSPPAPQGPTGQVNNTNATSFLLPNPASPGTNTNARFIFANLNGTISAWPGGGANAATIVATTPGAVYTGLAINSAQTQLYGANTAGGTIDVFNSAFAPVSLAPGAFTNPFPGLVPFNVQNIGGNIYVTYAPPGRANQINAGPGQGGVAVFNESGGLISTLINGSELASPWGLALAPADFGSFGGDLLVGNFSFLESEINAFDPTTGAFLGTIPINAGPGNTPGGLWALNFGSGAGNGGSANILYFNDGINSERDGLFAAISAVPEPSTLAVLATALMLGGGCYRLRARNN